jgi:hypothetical protein
MMVFGRNKPLAGLPGLPRIVVTTHNEGSQMDALKEMDQEARDRAFYNAVMSDTVISDAFSLNTTHNTNEMSEWTARVRYSLLQFMRADKTGKRMVAEDFGMWFLANAETFVNEVADLEY